ncbi:MAG: hypothetical protein ACRDPI_04695 [Nocardioidaceae bacterium]
MNVSTQTEAPAHVPYWWEALEAPDMEAETMFASLLARYQADRGVVVEDQPESNDVAGSAEQSLEEPVTLVGATPAPGWATTAPFEYSWDGLQLDYA